MNIGDEVEKISGKPFKSKNKINTIKAFCSNESDPKGRPAVQFVEDDSVVSLYQLTAKKTT